MGLIVIPKDEVSVRGFRRYLQHSLLSKGFTQNVVYYIVLTIEEYLLKIISSNRDKEFSIWMEWQIKDDIKKFFLTIEIPVAPYDYTKKKRRSKIDKLFESFFDSFSIKNLKDRAKISISFDLQK